MPNSDRAAETKASEVDALKITGIKQLHELVKLEGCRFDRVSAERIPTKRVGSSETIPETTQAKFGVSCRYLPDHTKWHVSITANVEGRGASFELKLTLRYTFDEPSVMSPRVEEKFLNDSVFMTAMPFLREGLMDLAGRLRTPAPLIPLFGPHSQAAFQVNRD